MLDRPALMLVPLLLVTACAARPVRVPFGALAPGLDAFLAAHPPAPGQAIRVDEVGRTASASYHLVQARGSEAPHRHLAHDLTVTVLRGGGTLVLDGRALPLAAGDVAVVPRGAAHWFRHEGRETALALAVFAPPLDAPDSVPLDGR